MLALLELPCCLIVTFCLPSKTLNGHLTIYNELIILDKNEIDLLKDKAVLYSSASQGGCMFQLFFHSCANQIVVFNKTSELQSKLCDFK